MKTFYKIVIVTFLLNGCNGKSPTDNLVDIATGTVDTMYNAIPQDCRNDTVEKLRATSKEQIKAINDACTIQKDALRAKIREKNAIILSLCLLVLVYVGGRLFLSHRR